VSFIKKLFCSRSDESFNISFISIIKINGHLLVNFHILQRRLDGGRGSGKCIALAIIYDLYQGAIWRAIYFHLIRFMTASLIFVSRSSSPRLGETI